MKFLTSALAFTLFLAPASFAGNDKQEEQAKKPSASVTQKDLKQVEGTILQHKLVNVFKDKNEREAAEKSGKAEKQMLVVLLKTANGNDRLVVDLGEIKDMPKIKDGETQLQVEGKMVNIGDKNLFVAKRAKLNGSLIEIQRKSS